MGEIVSSYHKVAIHRSDANEASLVLSDETVPADRDFELIWSPKSSNAPNAALFLEEIKGEPYYLLMITPPTLRADETPSPREVTFVIDTSGSMAGESIRQARESLLLAIKRLKPGDAFNIIQFNNGMDQLFARPQPVNSETVSNALAYIRRLTANGGTMMLPALNAALVDHGLSDNRLRQVVFLTDGAIGNEQQLFESIAQNRGDARIFTIGIGSAPNSFFMSRAAELGQGAFTHIGAVSEVAERMGALFSKLETPAVTNLAIDWPEGATVEAWPSPIPDIYKGETLVVAARADKERGNIWVSGEQNGQSWKAALPLERAAKRAGVSKLWARKKIAALELARVRPGAEREAIDGKILTVALDHNLISRLTSLVAVDVTPSRQVDETVARADVPLNLPKGWVFEKVFGEELPKLQREASAPGLLKTRERFADAADAPAGQNGAGVALPQGATLANVKLYNGFILMSFGVLMLILVSRKLPPVAASIGFRRRQ